MAQGRIQRLVLSFFAFLAVSANADQFPAIPGEYIVKLKSTVSTSSVSAIKALGAVKQVVSHDMGMVLVQRPMVEKQETAMSILSQNPNIEYVEPNYIYRVLGGATDLPNDPKLSQLWGMINSGAKSDGDEGQIQGVAGIDIDAQRAWQIETGSKNVIVAVIDTGVNYNNPDLAPNIFTNLNELNGQPGVDDDANGCVDDIHGCDFSQTAADGDPMDVYGHGTHCAGTIGAKGNDGLDIVGVAWDVTMLPVRFLGDNGGGSLAGAILAIEYATKMGATIMSNSWGGGGFSQALMDVIVKSKEAGILFVAAAGNSASDNDRVATYPANYEVDNIISVAAIDNAGRMAGFSNYGKTKVHIGAPGVNVLSHTMRGLQSWSGTSMATPHVAGVAALLYSQDMTQSYTTIKERILASARPISSMRNRVSTAGIVNAYYALTNTVSPPDLDDPYSWAKAEGTGSTPHPYANNYTQTFTFTVPGAARVAVYFPRFETEGGYDKVTFTDANGVSYGVMSGSLGEAFGPAVTGDTVIMTFTSDNSQNKYGFDVGGIAYQTAPEEAP